MSRIGYVTKIEDERHEVGEYVPNKVYYKDGYGVTSYQLMDSFNVVKFNVGDEVAIVYEATVTGARDKIYKA